MELFYNVKKNGLIILVKSVILLLLLFLIYLLFSFSKNITAQIDKTAAIGEGRELFSIADQLLNPEEFFEFRQSKNSLETVHSFYQKLNTNQQIHYLSAFHQPLQIASFKGNVTFDYRYGADSAIEELGHYVDPLTNEEIFDAKSFQVNQQFFEFYAIETENGTAFDWGNVNFDEKVLPIFLGAEYKPYYRVGEKLKGRFYTREFEFEVIDFLKENTSVFYKNEINKYLDSYILLAYPETLPTITEQNKEFYGILAFAMFGGDIVLEDGRGFDFLNALLARTAKETSFYSYTLLGMSAFTMQYQRMYELINYNYLLLLVIFLCIGLLTILIIFYLTYKMYERRRQRYYFSYFNGEWGRRTKSLLLWDTFLGNSFMLAVFAISFLLMPVKDYSTFFIILLGGICLGTLDAVFYFSFYNKDMKTNFRALY
ncbi:hypothetical protein D920_01421 [Enterococcus faecalis 13-SD-W-01]|nr:hypothetical protein D920_01421 [Enterococcus faecalis 13-SD-W-01]